MIFSYDKEGRVATHTGTKCIKHAGHRVGDNFSVQTNMMLTDEVWTAMAEVFQNNTELRLPERIIKSLEAAESVGGDIRGKQSAALLVVEGEAPKKKWEDPLIDLRIEDHEEPVIELNRLMRSWRAYELMDKAMEQGDIEKALEEYNAAQAMCPDNLEIKYWTAVSLANANNITQALGLFKEVFKKDENWRRLTERLIEVELLKVREEEFKRILEAF